jgi:hypothetical protein
MLERYCCANLRRRTLVDKHATLNGIDFLEVSDVGVPDDDFRERILVLRCLKPLTPAEWSRDNVVITGGVRVTPVTVTFAAVLSSVNTALFATVMPYLDSLKLDPDAGKTLLILTDVRGDFSDYQLTLRASAANPLPPPNFDPMLSSVAFRFKVECPSDFDCRPVTVCTSASSTPDLDYQAKDYLSFRQLMLDRMAITMPEWKERSPADIEIALVELLAYTGDHLSYFQDWVSTEAYLRTARSRVSVRRHARLLDYFMHDGVNARTWIAFEVDPAGDGLAIPKGTPILSASDATGVMIAPGDFRPLTETAVVFETMSPITLRRAHDRIEFYTWSDQECCLPSGSTSATLVFQAGMTLGPGSVLVLEEVLNPETGGVGGVNRQHRHAVRLTSSKGLDDAAPIRDPLDLTRLVEVTWNREDATPFPLCISHLVQNLDGTQQLVGSIAVARGNVVLADHGVTLPGQPLNPMTVPASGPYRPQVIETPVTQCSPPPAAAASATAALKSDPSIALPSLKLRDTISQSDPWSPARDLLETDALARRFVLEVEANGDSFIRFGDDVHGRRPAPGSNFAVDYRMGTGVDGNVGPESLTRIVLGGIGIRRVWNPLPGGGGLAPESPTRVRLVAPQAFRVQKRAVTEADYADKARLHPEVQNAVAHFRWTGSWYTVFLTVDRRNGLALDDEFRASLLSLLDTYRMAGHDMELRPPQSVPIDLKLEVCVSPGYFAANVKQALLEVFSNRTLLGGGLGFFHPDRFTFGQRLYLSQVYQTAMEVAGVDSVRVLVFERFGRVANHELDDGYIQAGKTEVLRLDNDPNFPEAGRIQFEMEGGL